MYSITISNVVYCYQTKFHTDVTAAPIKKACVAMMKKAIRQQRYKLKKRYFNALPLHMVPKKSPVTSMTDEQWDKLVAHWKNEQKMVSSTHSSRTHHVDVICA